ncbi:MAG: P-loop NTPase [Deltaproteobacteria bacterium]|nr:P-loop NTPase [Deltaproteobacteria bacterium]
MGLFHCPVGAAYYDDEECIDCGMCYAKTSAERVEASKKIRAYFQAHAARNAVPRKIALCGKGGVGKSTMTALLARALRAEGNRVLVLDTDESNPGLYRLLGLEREPRYLISLRKRDPGAIELDGAWLDREQIALDDIPAEFAAGGNGFRFMMIGKIEDPFQGCACSMANVVKEFMEKLTLGDGEIVVIDMEAGVESFGRGVERFVDTILAVVEPSYESMALAGKIAYMAQGMGIGRIGAVLNKVPTENVRARMAEELGKKGVKVVGTILFDPGLNEAGFEGRPIASEDSAREDIQGIVKSLFE